MGPNPERIPVLNTMDWLIKIETPGPLGCFEMAAQTREEALEWGNKIRDTAQSALHREDESKKKERALRIARELSNLVIYCRSVVFNHEK